MLHCLICVTAPEVHIACCLPWLPFLIEQWGKGSDEPIELLRKSQNIGRGLGLYEPLIVQVWSKNEWNKKKNYDTSFMSVCQIQTRSRRQCGTLSNTLTESVRNSYPSLAKNTHIQTAMKLSDWGLTKSNLFHKLQQNSLIFLQACWHWSTRMGDIKFLQLILTNLCHTGQPYLYIYFPLCRAHTVRF